jgi:signal transduction histidine kinase
MMSFFGSRNRRDKTSKVDLEKLTKLEDAVNAIFDLDVSSESNDLFSSVAESIYKLTGAYSVIIGKYQGDTHSIRTLAFWDNGCLSENFTYGLKGTPCEKVIGNRPCSYPAHVSKLFPLDRALSDRHIEAYVGVPFFYSHDKPMGIIAAMYNTDVEEVKVIEALLRIYSIRVAAEIEHLEYHEILEIQNNELNSLFDELREKNQELDQSILEIEKARAAEEESNQLKTAFLANLSHEVRTPMNVMLGFAELLKSEVLTKEDRIEYIDIINQNGIQLLKIMDNLIEISKFQSKKLVHNTRPIHLNALLERFFATYLDYIRVLQKPLKLELEKALPDSADFVIADHEGVSKVFEQLLDNAVKFTPSGTVRFGYEIDKKVIRFYVQDTGIGIPEGMEEKIFDMFRQVDLRASREFGGNGLGLAIARKYTELMDGKIWVQRIEQGGTCFCFNIPYVKAPISEDHRLRLN